MRILMKLYKKLWGSKKEVRDKNEAELIRARKGKKKS